MIFWSRSNANIYKFFKHISVRVKWIIIVWDLLSLSMYECLNCPSWFLVLNIFTHTHKRRYSTRYYWQKRVGEANASNNRDNSWRRMSKKRIIIGFSDARMRKTWYCDALKGMGLVDERVYLVVQNLKQPILSYSKSTVTRIWHKQFCQALYIFSVQEK